MKVFVVTYVGLSDTEYDANGYSEVSLHTTLEGARKKLALWKEAEIAFLAEEGREYEILEDKDDRCHISWNSHGDQIIIEVHPAVEIDIKGTGLIETSNF